MDYKEFIKPELIILIPVLYCIGAGIRKSALRNAIIPFILGGAGVVLSAIYLFASEPISNAQEVATAIFFTGMAIFTVSLIKDEYERRYR